MASFWFTPRRGGAEKRVRRPREDGGRWQVCARPTAAPVFAGATIDTLRASVSPRASSKDRPLIPSAPARRSGGRLPPPPPPSRGCRGARKSVVKGKVASVRVDLGGRGSLKKKKT